MPDAGRVQRKLESMNQQEPATKAGQNAIRDFGHSLDGWVIGRESDNAVRMWLVEMRKPLEQFLRLTILLVERECNDA